MRVTFASPRWSRPRVAPPLRPSRTARSSQPRAAGASTAAGRSTACRRSFAQRRRARHRRTMRGTHADHSRRRHRRPRLSLQLDSRQATMASPRSRVTPDGKHLSGITGTRRRSRLFFARRLVRRADDCSCAAKTTRRRLADATAALRPLSPLFGLVFRRRRQRSIADASGERARAIASSCTANARAAGSPRRARVAAPTRAEATTGDARSVSSTPLRDARLQQPSASTLVAKSRVPSQSGSDRSAPSSRDDRRLPRAMYSSVDAGSSEIIAPP